MQITSSIEPVSILDQIVEAPGHHRHPLTAPRAAAAFDGMTPLWTRHTVGAIEADRDRRLEHRAHAPIRYRTPRAETVVVHGDFAGGRWADDGGSFDHDATGSLRVSTGAMARPTACSSYQGRRASVPALRAGTTASERRPSVSAPSISPKSRSAMS